MRRRNLGLMESLEDRLWETIFRDGQRLLREGKHDLALKEFRAALNISEKFETDDPRKTQSLNGLAIAHTVRQEFADAEPLFQQAVDLLARNAGDGDVELARVLKHLALVYGNQHKLQPAEETYARALAIYERVAPAHPDVETIRTQLGKLQKRISDAKRRQADNEMLVIIKPKHSKTLEDKQSDGPSVGGGPISTDGAGRPPSGGSKQTAESRLDIRTASPENLVGKVLDDRYEVTERVAAGGMSVIYKARHALLDRNIAIKVMHPHLVANTRNVKRFQQEAKTASALTHPNICNVRDFGVTKDGLCYIVMDYVDGETLATRINRDHHLTAGEFVEIVKQLVDALTYAHQNQVLHRDLKPSNIMLQKSGSKTIAKLVDFGIAKVVSKEGEDALSLTQTGETVGSPLYMSPEQCRGIPIDHRSDIYSLGCLAYKALTGFPPFLGGSDIDVYFKHINEPAPPFSIAAPDLDVPPDLEALVMKCLEKDPNNRPQSMDEVRQGLDDIQA